MFELKRLWEMLASTAEPDGEQPAETEIIPAEGEERELATRFNNIRCAIPVVATLTPRQPDVAMTADEVAAWDMLRQHSFSRQRMEREGELSGFLSLGVRPELEARWRGEYMERLLEGYPDGRQAFLDLISEYGDRPMLARLIALLDDRIGTTDAPGEAVLSDCAGVLALLDDPRFEGTEAMRQKVLETVRRGIHILSECDPDGDWRQVADAWKRRLADQSSQPGVPSDCDLWG